MVRFSRLGSTRPVDIGDISGKSLAASVAAIGLLKAPQEQGTVGSVPIPGVIHPIAIFICEERESLGTHAVAAQLGDPCIRRPAWR